MSEKPTYEELEHRINELNKITGRYGSLVDAINQSNIGLLIVDSDYRIRFMNQPLIDEYEDQTGRTCYKGLGKKNSACEYCKLDEVLQHRRMISYQPTTHSGRIYDIVAVPFEDTDGELCKLEIIQNITTRKRAEDLLQQSEEKYRSLVTATSQIIWATDSQGNVVQDLPTWRAYTGQNLEETKGSGWINALHPEDRERTNAIWKHSVATRSLYDTEFRIRRQDGEYRYFAVRGIPIQNTDGSIREWIGACTDITERKRAEDKLKNSQEQLQLVIMSSNDAPWDWNLITNEIVYSPQWWKQIGYAPDELPADAALWERLLHPEDGEHVSAIFGAALKSNKDSYAIEARLLHKEGHYVPVLSRGFITRDEAGKPIRITGTNMDLTEKKKTEAERERLLQCIEQSGEATVITDPNGVVQYVNKTFEKLTGYTREEVTAQTLKILNSGKQDNSFYHKMWSTISQGHIFEGKMVNKRKDGTLYTDYTTIAPVFETNGNIVNYIAVSRDITEHLQQEKQLRQAQKMESVGQLAGGVAHDYNNMLSVILGYTELVMAKVEQANPIYEDLCEIRDAARRSTDITRQLLAFARKQEAMPIVLDLNTTVDGMLKMLRRLIGEDIALTFLPMPNLWLVKVDPTQVDQILANLCVNARYAINGVGKVVIETDNIQLDEVYCSQHSGALPGEYMLLTVSDNGCGIRKADQSKIFEPFFTTKGVDEGTGLGLATVYGITKQNKGFISVYSELGQGTTFKIYLPRYTASETTVVEKSPENIDTQAHGETIMIVEDDPSTLRLATRILNGLGYSVISTQDPTEAVKLAQDQKGEIHMLLTDVIMPEMTGKDLAKSMLVLNPALKILFMSGYTADIISRQGVLSEGVNFLQKPFSSKSMALKVREVLDL